MFMEHFHDAACGVELILNPFFILLLFYNLQIEVNVVEYNISL